MNLNIKFSKLKILCLLLFFKAVLFAQKAPFPAGFEIPLCPQTSHSERIVEDHELRTFPDFMLCYREKYEQPEWVAYHLTKSELEKIAGRSNNFRADSLISTESAQLEDYRGSGYDRGHLAPAADFSFSKEAMSNTFFMSNMSPQNPSFNRGIWSSLENKVRSWAEFFGEVYVITGPILEKANYATIGINKVAVPEFYYKVLCTKNPENGAIIMIAFILPNEKSDKPLEDFAVTVASLEKRTNLNFFYLLEDPIEKKLESKVVLGDWF